MRRSLFVGAACAAFFVTPSFAATNGIAAPSVVSPQALTAPQADTGIYLVQGNSGKGNGNGNNKRPQGKPDKGNGGGKAKAPGNSGDKGPKAKTANNGNAGKPQKAAKANGNGNNGNGQGKQKIARDLAPVDRPGKRGDFEVLRGDDGRYRYSDERRRYDGLAWDGEERDLRRIVSTAAPLLLLGSSVDLNDLREDELVAYRNCPPGLAKKSPPCVPPGLAKKGVGYDEWVSGDDAYYDRVYRERRDDILRRYDSYPDADWRLGSDYIAGLYGLDPAPSGQRYGLIDGLPVLLSDEDYAGLQLINSLAGVPNIANGSSISPTLALTQPQLVNRYGLPPLQDGNNYAVVNGQVVQLDSDAYELLQLIRVARAIF
ncbi:hypothetical protein ABMC89_02640 [Sulfitobacter sp. HNIBRBA3233]|uniref:hypothetical protein n=1 Tax=Sulfitobacter marinivivus TaxID=3158558 RepID=UPI0032DF6A34